MSLIAVVLKLGYAGLVAADVGVHVTALANEGAGIYREIPNRRQALEQIQIDYEHLQKKFDDDMVQLAEQSATINESLLANNLIYQDLDGVFSSLTTLQDQFVKQGLADPNNVLTLKHSDLTPSQFKAIDYLVPVVGTTFFTGELFFYMKHMYRGTTRVDNAIRAWNDIRLWKKLTPAQQKMLTAKKFGIKNPITPKRFTVLKSGLIYSGMAAVSIASITYKAVKEREELEDLNAAIAGVQKNIEILNGNITPTESDFHGEISPDIADYVYSFPKQAEHRETLTSFAKDDFENWSTIVTFFRDVYTKANMEQLQAWRESMDVASPDKSLYELLYNLVFYPKGIPALSQLSCYTKNDWQLTFDNDFFEVPYPYESHDMRCVQDAMHTFFSSVGVAVLRLAVDMAPNIPSEPGVDDKKRQDIISVCKNRIYKDLDPTAIRRLIKRTKFVSDQEIEQVVREDLNGQCPFPN